MENENINEEVTDTQDVVLKTNSHDEVELKSLLNRLNRIEGQVNGLKKMLLNDTYCTDILIQVSATTAALNAFSKELLTSHLKNFVCEKLKQGDDSAVDEFAAALQRMMK